MLKPFTAYLEELHEKRGTELLDKHDGPQFYERQARMTLREFGYTGVLPLVIDARREWKVSGRTLRDAIDFIGQMSYSAPDRGGGGCYDVD